MPLQTFSALLTRPNLPPIPSPRPLFHDLLRTLDHDLHAFLAAHPDLLTVPRQLYDLFLLSTPSGPLVRPLILVSAALLTTLLATLLDALSHRRS